MTPDLISRAAAVEVVSDAVWCCMEGDEALDAEAALLALPSAVLTQKELHALVLAVNLAPLLADVAEAAGVVMRQQERIWIDDNDSGLNPAELALRAALAALGAAK